MNTRPGRFILSCVLSGVLGCVHVIATSRAMAADTQVQQQLQQREQQQMELRLKMQQQLDRAIQLPQGIHVPPGIHAPPGVSGDLKRRQLERDQQQRLQQLHQQQSRGLLAPAPAGQTGLERERDLQGGSQELKHFEFQRRMETDRREP